jgi:ABC-type transport system involved in multi-copper enzyme maturation permease subunit
MPPQFRAMIQAELQAVFRRGSGKAALVASVLVGLVIVFGFHQVAIRAGADSANQARDLFDSSARGALGGALRLRNFFIIPLFLVLAVGASVSEEMHDNTLREVLIRPVNRVSVLAAKLIALCSLSAATLALTFGTTLLLGAPLLGMAEAIDAIALGYLASFGSDVGLICMALVPAVLLRGSGPVVLAVVLFLIADFTLRYAFKAIGPIADKFGQQDLAGLDEIAAYFPGEALACWEGWKDGFEGAQFAGLGAIIVICIAGATARFLRRDFA